MKRWLLVLALSACAHLAHAQTLAALPAQFCEQGGAQAVTSGLKSTNYLRGLVPSCTVTVYLTGTQTLASIYSNNTGTVLSNPFTASSQGQWTAYAAINQGYDVVLSGGVCPNCYSAPVTLTGLYPGTNINISGAGNPAPPAYAVQYANSSASSFAADPGITINPTSHTLLTPVMNNIAYADGYANLFPSGGSWQGAWSSSTVYPMCAAVSYGGASYVAGVGNTGQEPDTAWSYWWRVNSTGNSTTPTYLDCAVAALGVQTIGQNTNESLYLGNNTAGYNTCTGLTLSSPSTYSSSAINLIGAAYSGSSIRQSCSISQPTIYLPIETGSYAAGKTKQIDMERLYVDSQQNATLPVGILGTTKNSTFFNIHARNGTQGDFQFGVNGNNDAWQYQDKMYQLFAEYSWAAGTGAAGTVSLSAGIPTVTMSSGGSGYTSTARAYLVGYQNGTSNQPCTSMGTTTPVISGGVVTGVTTTASGCSGTVYVDFDDTAPIPYGTDMDFVTDSFYHDLEEVAGYKAGLLDNHGSNSIFGHHAFTEGQYGSELHSYDNVYGENCGEQSMGCWNLSSPIKISGANYYSSTQYNGYTLIHQNAIGNGMQASNISCSFAQSGEYHTFVSPSGTVDSGSSLLGNNKLDGVAYCGSGSGSTIYYHPTLSAESLTISGTTQPLLNWGVGTTNYWQDYVSSANGNRRIYDLTNSLLRFELVPNGTTSLDSGLGGNSVNINLCPTASPCGSGGLVVGTGTGNGVAGGISGSGKITGSSVALSGNPGISSGTASNTDLNGVLTLSGGTATYTFAGTYTSAPICTASDTTSAAAVKASASTTVLTLTGTGTDSVNYICVGRN